MRGHLNLKLNKIDKYFFFLNIPLTTLGPVLIVA